MERDTLASMESKPDGFGEDYWKQCAAARWIKNHDALIRALECFGREVLEAAQAREGETVIDVGCGGGPTTTELARAVGPTGRVIGLDVSEDMLVNAASHCPGDVLVDWICADATTWVAEAPADLVFSRFGVMFFSDPPRAFRRLHDNLRVGGRLAVACWGTPEENPWICDCYRAIQDLVNAPPLGTESPGPHSLSDDSAVQELLVDAGFCDVRIRRFTAPIVFSDRGLEEAVNFAMVAGPAGRALGEATEEIRALARERFTELLRPAVTPHGVAMNGTSLIVTARR